MTCQFLIQIENIDKDFEKTDMIYYMCLLLKSHNYQKYIEFDKMLYF